MGLKKGKIKGYYDFSGGINVSTVANIIADNELQFDFYHFDGTKNCYWDNGIRKRAGLSKKNTTAFTNIKGGIRYYGDNDYKCTLFADFNGTNLDIYCYDDINFTKLFTLTDVDEDRDVFFCQWKNAIYMTTGITPVKKFSYNGSSWSVLELDGLKDASGNVYHPQFIYQFKDRLWTAGGNMPESYFECSAYDDDNEWTYGDYAKGEGFNAGYKEGDKIMGLSSVADMMVVFKYDSIWVLQGDNLINWFQKKSQKEIGCNASKSIVGMHNYIIFASNDGIFVFDGVNLVKISYKIDQILNHTFNKEKFKATFDGRFYRLAINKDDDNTNYELIFDVLLFKQNIISWWFNDFGININGYVNYNGEMDDNELIILSDTNYYIYTGYSDDGNDIEMKVVTKAFDFGLQNILKRYGIVKFNFTGYAGTYHIRIYRNINKDLFRDYTYESANAELIWDGGNWDEDVWNVEGLSNYLKEIALPSLFDGYNLVIEITHNETKGENILFFGFTIEYNVARY